MTILELMHGIRDLDYVLPEFQREYVWNREQAKQLMVSLFKEYPTGSLLFWRTTNPPEIKNDAVRRDKIGTTFIIVRRAATPDHAVHVHAERDPAVLHRSRHSR